MPVTAGVQANTCSGDMPLAPHVPVSVLAPVVVPPNIPPSGGTIVGALQGPPLWSVLVVVVLVDVAGRLVAVAGDDGVVIEVIVVDGVELLVGVVGGVIGTARQL